MEEVVETPTLTDETAGRDALRERLIESLAAEDGAAPVTILGELDPRDAMRAVCDLDVADQASLLTALPVEDAAELLVDLPDVTAVDSLAAVAPEVAATIVHHLPSDEQADLIGALDTPAAAAILSELADDEAERISELAAYDDDTAGGLMATEVIALRDIATVGTTLRRLRAGANRLRELDVQYAYVVAKGRRLVGVLRLRDVLIADESDRLEAIMIAAPVTIAADKPLDDLVAFFDTHGFFGVPVVDPEDRLLGVVSRRAVDLAAQERATSDYRRSMGVVVEELRSMPTLRRSRLRLAWLSVNILLNVASVSVIAFYEETLSKVIALAVFMPIISDMSGCSGNQAVAVSMRELSLGLLKPTEWLRVWAKEASVGLINGLVLGLFSAVVAGLYASNPWLGVVVGGALGVNTVIAVLLGGALPLVLKRLGVDPALASGPILTTVTDMCGFFAALSLATLLLSRLV